MTLLHELKDEEVEQEAGNVGDGAATADLLRRAIVEIKGLRKHIRTPFADPAFAKALVEWAGEQTIKEQQAKITRLQDIITGALAHSHGPYSDKELLRRVVVILKSKPQSRGGGGGGVI